MYHSKVRNNVGTLKGLLKSLQCSIDLADRGSTVEDDYVLEELEKFANVLNRTLVTKVHEN